ncbi:MAG: 7-cyano-7-deazaguanine synthase QueC [Proteobacteria bacterium]|nr:7-cyano-7-deazaguanine synthase QueC [Pseudomonadota bacterium]
MCRRDLAVVLVSGGMDSCVTASIASIDYSLAFLHVNYGHRTEKREERAFNDLCNFFKPVKKLIVDISYLKQIGGSALTDKNIEIPKGGLSKGCVPSTYVPFRNAHLLSIAVSWAEVIGAKRVYIGAVEEDSSGYPDCKEEFFVAFQEAVNKGTKPDTEIKIFTPLIHKSKAEIVKIGMHLGSPLELSWSCYSEEDIACGVCESCILRLKGFKEAGYEDKIPYREKK